MGDSHQNWFEIEQSEAYEIGFRHGLEEGVDMNPFEKDFERYCYRRGYDAGVSEYCRQEHPEDENNKLTKYPFEEGNTYYTIELGEVVESCWDDVSEEIHDENPNMRYFKTREEAEKDIKKMLDLCGDF